MHQLYFQFIVELTTGQPKFAPRSWMQVIMRVVGWGVVGMMVLAFSMLVLAEEHNLSEYNLADGAGLYLGHVERVVGSWVRGVDVKARRRVSHKIRKAKWPRW